MPTNLVGNPASFPTQTAPVGGDPRTASSVSTPLQNAADRSEYLKDRLIFLDPNQEGVRRIRNVTGGPAAIQALTDHSDGDFILEMSTGFLYQYFASSAATVTTYGIIKPTDVVGNGRWISSLLTGGVGFSELLPGPLNASGDVPATQILDGIRAKATYVSGPTITTTSVTHVDMTGFEATITGVVAGDIVTAEYCLGIAPAAGSVVSLRPKVTDPALVTTTVYDDIWAREGLGASREDIQSGTFHFVSTLSGTYKIFWQWYSASGGLASAIRRSLHVTARVP